MKEIIEQIVKKIESLEPSMGRNLSHKNGYLRCKKEVLAILESQQGKEEKEAGLWYKISDREIQYYAQYYVFDGNVVRQAWYASNGEESFWTATISNEIIENVTHVQKMVEPKKPIS